MKAGQGMRELPAWEGEACVHYIHRLAIHLGYKVGWPEPDLYDTPDGKPPKREPGEDRD